MYFLYSLHSLLFNAGIDITDVLPVLSRIPCLYGTFIYITHFSFRFLAGD